MSDHLNQSELDLILSDGAFEMKESSEVQISGKRHSCGAFLVTIKGRPMMGPNAVHVIDTLEKLLEGMRGSVMIDLSRCQYLSSIALGFVANLAVEKKAKGAQIVLFGLSEQVRNIIHILELDRILVIRDDLEEAIRAATAP